MKEKISKAVVLGAGNMGAQLAAHLANSGLDVWLLDMVPTKLTGAEAQAGLSQTDKMVRNRLAAAGLESVRRAKPAALYLPEFASRIRTGNFDDHLEEVRSADWVIEAVVERMDIKKQLLAKVDALRQPGTLVTSNTSGLSIGEMSADCSEDFQQHFMGTHFFNPVRYMRLLEIIRTKKTLPQAVSLMETFCDRRLGKGVVYAQDTPNFIANRIGTFAAFFTIHYMLQEGFTIEEVDLLTGPVIGHPKMASFRLADFVGVDILVYVAKTLYDGAPEDEARQTFQSPDFLTKMVANQWLGKKTGQGFYKKVKKDGQTEVLALDPQTMEYRPRMKASFPSVDLALGIEDVGERVKGLLSGKDRAADFTWKTTAATLAYAARRVPEISEDIVNVDRAMRWGYNWELGPFQMWDALGVRDTVERMQKEGLETPPLAEALLEQGHDRFYRKVDGTMQFFDMPSKSYRPLQEPAGMIYLPGLKDRQRVIAQNSGATFLDLGDGVACLEFHTKMNAIGTDIMTMMRSSVEETERNFQGLVVGNQGENFSVGANIMLLLLEAQQENWEEIDLMIRTFQNTTMALRYSQKPVVAAPFGMALGGGCEVTLGADRIRAAAECYIGLVEVGVGLIPAGGGCKEMILRATDRVGSGSTADFTPYLQKVFETIGMAKYSTSAYEARQMGFLRDSDGISVNRDRLIADAKKTVLAMVAEGYRQPEKRTDLVALGEPALALLKLGIHMLKRGGYISDYDAHIGGKLANILTGGRLPRKTLVTEQHFLDLEREAFLSLCGERKTQERIQHMLQKGKPLRN